VAKGVTIMKANFISTPVTLRIHPLATGAAVTVIILSVVGIGAFTGWIPSALSQKRTSATATAPAAPALSNRAGSCAVCGVIESIHTVQVRANPSGLGALTGGVTGAALGNTIGQGNGTTAMTILGAAGGALAGNEIEKNVKQHIVYRVTVRMDDGSVRTVSQTTPPALAIGDKVRVVNGTVVHE
jgi:outer membrane lipoprotein SlyB